MTIPGIALKVRSNQYSQLLVLGGSVVKGLTDNPDFIMPAIPVAILQNAVNDVSDAKSKWGTKDNHGSTQDLADLKQKAILLHQLLKAEAAFVMTTATIAAEGDFARMASIMSTSGFGLRASKHKQGALLRVQNLMFMPSGALNRNQVKVVWDRPLEITSPINVKSYNVYRSATAEFADAVQIDTVSKTELVDSNNTGKTVTWSYFIVAIGASGKGAVSYPITITLLPA